MHAAGLGTTPRASTRIVPIYQQVRKRIVEAIAAGEPPAGSGLPSIRQLAVDLGINLHTVNKAYDLLRREGLLQIGRKAGAVVQRDAAGGPPRPGPAGSGTGSAGCGHCWPRPPPRAWRPLFRALMAQGRRSPGRLPTDETHRPHRTDARCQQAQARVISPNLLGPQQQLPNHMEWMMRDGIPRRRGP
jgi:DNA-binding transcriptional MocR family regulator